MGKVFACKSSAHQPYKTLLALKATNLCVNFVVILKGVLRVAHGIAENLNSRNQRQDKFYEIANKKILFSYPHEITKLS